MATTVAGVYENGLIKLLERPAGVPEGRVRVTLAPERVQPRQRRLSYGKYRGGRVSCEDDFHIAEWRGEDAPADG